MKNKNNKSSTFYSRMEYFSERKLHTNKFNYFGSFAEVFEEAVSDAAEHMGTNAEFHKVKYKNGIADISFTIDGIDIQFKGDSRSLSDHLCEELNGTVLVNTSTASLNDWTRVEFVKEDERVFTQEEIFGKLLDAGMFTEVGKGFYKFNATWFSK